jgi:hypothetical protein
MWTFPSSSSSLVGLHNVVKADEDWCNFVSVSLFCDDNTGEIALLVASIFRVMLVVVKDSCVCIWPFTFLFHTRKLTKHALNIHS